MATAATRVHALAESLSVRRARVVGHDIGMMVAYAYAATHPTEVDRLVLMESFLPGIGDWHEYYYSARRWHFVFNGPTAEKLVAGRRALGRSSGKRSPSRFPSVRCSGSGRSSGFAPQPSRGWDWPSSPRLRRTSCVAARRVRSAARRAYGRRLHENAKRLCEGVAASTGTRGERLERRAPPSPDPKRLSSKLATRSSKSARRQPESRRLYEGSAGIRLQVRESRRGTGG